MRASSAARPSATAPSLSTVRASSVRVSPVLKRRPRSQPSVRAPSATAPSSSAVLRHGGFGLPPTSPSPADLTRHRTRVVTVTLAVASRGCPRLLHELCDPGECCRCLLPLSLLPLPWMCCCQSTKLLGAADSKSSPGLPSRRSLIFRLSGPTPMPVRLLAVVAGCWPAGRLW